MHSFQVATGVGQTRISENVCKRFQQASLKHVQFVAKQLRSERLLLTDMSYTLDLHLPPYYSISLLNAWDGTYFRLLVICQLHREVFGM